MARFNDYLLIILANNEDETFEKDIKPQNPLLFINIVGIEIVEVFVNSVHKNVVCHIKVVMKELSEQLSVHSSVHSLIIL